MATIARCRLPDGRVVTAQLEGDFLALVQEPVWDGLLPTGEVLPLAGARLLAPCLPRTILCVGLNYASHLHGRPIPDPPTLFFKPLSSLTGPGEAIVIPEGATNVQAEGEIVIVIGRRVHRADRAAAAAAIFGVTAGVDVTERDWQRSDGQWWRAKGADTFGVLGPAIATGLPLDGLELVTRINGVEVQRGRSEELIRDIPEIVRLASAAITLEPGDVIYTGTPGEPRPLAPGDVVEVAVSGAGVLRNPVVGPALAPRPGEAGS